MKKIKIIRIILLTAILIGIVNIDALTTLTSNYLYYNNKNSNGTYNNVKESIDELYTLSKNLNNSVTFKIGDYVKMSPSKTSFTIPKTLSNCTANQTINTSELNLWRVINIKSNGNVEMVSENTSSVDICFKGKKGYQNFVGLLNYIANQYENKKYTVGSRSMGYNGQTEYITDDSKIVLNPAPWTVHTSNNTNEKVGGGDILYTTDTNLVTSALGTLKAYKAGTTTYSPYWLASRYYHYSDSTYWHYIGRLIDANGNITFSNSIYFYQNAFSEVTIANSFRPILTLKSVVYANGSGTKTSPYVLE